MKELWKKFLRWFYQEDLEELVSRDLLTKEDVMNVLNHMDKTDPVKRKLNDWDDKFIDLIPILHRYPEALDFLNRFGFICDTYFRHLKGLHPEHNYELQKSLCAIEEISIGDDLKKWMPKYRNLFFRFIESYDLLALIQKKLESDKKYEDLLQIYKKFH